MHEVGWSALAAKLCASLCNRPQALEFLATYNKAPASTVGSVVVTDLVTGLSVEEVDTAWVRLPQTLLPSNADSSVITSTSVWCLQVHFTRFPQEVAQGLVKEGKVMWCAGALMIEHPLVQPLIDRIEGTPDSIMGLSKALTMQLISKMAQNREFL